MMKKIKSSLSSTKRCLSSGIVSIAESMSTFSIWPNTTASDYHRGADEYMRRSGSYVKDLQNYSRKVGLSEDNDYIFNNPFLKDLDKYNIQNFEKDAENLASYSPTRKKIRQRQTV